LGDPFFASWPPDIRHILIEGIIFGERESREKALGDSLAVPMRLRGKRGMEESMKSIVIEVIGAGVFLPF